MVSTHILLAPLSPYLKCLLFPKLAISYTVLVSNANAGVKCSYQMLPLNSISIQ